MFLGARGENEFKLVQMNLERIWRKGIQKKKGAGAAGPTPPPFRPSERPGLLPPPPLSRARMPTSSQPASATWRPYAGEERAAAGHLHPPWSGRRLGLPSHSIHSVARTSPLPPPSARAARPQQLRRSAIAGAAPLLTAGHSSAPNSTPKPPEHSP